MLVATSSSSRVVKRAAIEASPTIRENTCLIALEIDPPPRRRASSIAAMISVSTSAARSMPGSVRHNSASR